MNMAVNKSWQDKFSGRFDFLGFLRDFKLSDGTDRLYLIAFNQKYLSMARVTALYYHSRNQLGFNPCFSGTTA